MSDIELCYMPATEVLAKFKAKKLSPVELLNAQLKRIEEVGSAVNALANPNYDEAQHMAQTAEAAYAKGSASQPLQGIPVALKDDTPWKDHVTTIGSLILKDNVDSASSPTTERILEAGAVIHVRTTTPEFCCATVTWSRLWGVTRSPWNLDLTCGGSSGGSGSALAAGLTTLASGSDIGGSIRIPSACCGVVGFKAPYGRNPSEPPFNLDRYNHYGAMARNVADCGLFQNVLCGPHAVDIASIKPKFALPTEFQNIRGWKIALSYDLGFFEVSAEVRKHLDEVAAALRDAGAIVEEVDLGWTRDVIEGADGHLVGMFGNSLRGLAEYKDLMTSYVSALCDEAVKITPTHLLRTAEIEGAMYQRLSPILSQYRAMICPTINDMPLAADFDPARDKCMPNGKPGHFLYDWAMTYPFNMMSRCPVLAMPFEQTSWGAPFGVQIVGPTFEDEVVFHVGAALEKQSPWYHSKDRRPKL